MAVAMLVVGFVAYRLWSPPDPPMSAGEVRQTVDDALAEAEPPPVYAAEAYQVIVPSLVTVTTRFGPDTASATSDATDDDGGGSGQAPDDQGSGRLRGLGSGVVINQDGSILTAHHVVAGASVIEVTFADGTVAAAAVVASEPENDIAVLATSSVPEVVVPAVLGSTNGLRMGDDVFAVGNPLGLSGSISAGVVSGLNRSIPTEADAAAGADGPEVLRGLIQFDAAVNPGSSGGPLLNRNGQVIGIVTGLANPGEEDFFVGIGFAVPINIATGTAGGPPQ